MGAIACQRAQSASLKYAPNPKKESGAFGVFGLLIAYLVVLAVGIVAHLSIERFESAMNVAAIAGLAVLCAGFWLSSRRTGTDAAGPPYRDLIHHAISGVRDPDMAPKKAGSNPTDRWGPAPTIGFLGE